MTDDDVEAVAMAIVEQWKIAEHNMAAFTPNAIARAAITAYLSAMPQRDELWIGDMMIRHAPNGIWIGRRGGEGGEFALEHVERVIAQLYRENF